MQAVASVIESGCYGTCKQLHFFSWFSPPLLLYLERILYALNLVQEVLVCFQAVFHLCAAVDDGRVVTVADELTNAACRHFCVFLCQIHRYLTRNHKVTLAALASHSRRRYVEMGAYALYDVVNGKRLVVYLHSAFNDNLCQPHVDFAVVDDGVCHERVYDTLQVSDAAVGGLRYELNDITRYLQAVFTDFVLKNVYARR